MVIRFDKETLMKNQREFSLPHAFLILKTEDEMLRFLKDLCTPAELAALTERWRVCQILQSSDLSYREINAQIGASPTTVGRVARFLKTEPHQGYALVLERLKKQS
jgi:TrpR-related protein YerC/YecD